MSKLKRKANPLERVATALARIDRRLKAPGFKQHPELAHIPAPEPVVPDALTENVQLGGLALVEVKLTDAEEMVLAEAIKLENVRVKPTGQPYYSHPSYTLWFNRAFGRTGWTLRPVGKPQQQQVTDARSIVLIPFVLFIHQQPVAFAFGEQEFFPGSGEQTVGDAMEACVASALRRCAKRLGIGLELWDRVWIDSYMAEHCVIVRVPKRRNRNGDWKTVAVQQWRRKVDKPFADELGPDDRLEDVVDERGDEERPQRRPPSERGKNYAPANPGDTRAVSDKQLKRLYAITRNSGRNEDVVKQWLKVQYGYTSSTQITRGTYDAICKAIEAPGKLPEREN